MTLPSSFQLLKSFTVRTMPCILTEDVEIEVTRILFLAGQVDVLIPDPVRTLSGLMQPPATVIRVLPLGLHAVQHPLEREHR